MDEFKTMKCEDCGREIRAKLRMNEREFLDGYHGECSSCGWRYWPCDEDKATTDLIGRAVKNIQSFTDVFVHNKIHCPFADNVMDRCDNEKNPTVFCDPEHCPLGE